jgi:hypothetical protein
VYVLLKYALFADILLFYVKILNSVGCSRLVSDFSASIGIMTMKTVLYSSYFAYLWGGDPTEPECSNKSSSYVSSCIVLRPQKMNRQPKTGTSDGIALQVF